MSSQASATLIPAYILHRRPFKNSSLLIDLLTPAHGWLTCVAKGAKQSKASRSSGAAVLQPFNALLVSVSGRGEVKTLGRYEAVETPAMLSGDRLYSAYYINELLLKLLPRGEAHSTLFAAYAALLQALADNTNSIEVLLRHFEYQVLSELGYGLQLSHEARSGKPLEISRLYVFEPEMGPLAVEEQHQQVSGRPVISGDSLIALSKLQLNTPQHLAESKQLMRYLINHLLGGYHFKSRDFFQLTARNRNESE